MDYLTIDSPPVIQGQPMVGRWMGEGELPEKATKETKPGRDGPLWLCDVCEEEYGDIRVKDSNCPVMWNFCSQFCLENWLFKKLGSNFKYEEGCRNCGFNKNWHGTIVRGINIFDESKSMSYSNYFCTDMCAFMYSKHGKSLLPQIYNPPHIDETDKNDDFINKMD